MRSLLLLVSASLAPIALQAQGMRPDTTRLPELTPRAVEVRGELRIELPSLERQPLTGFELTPRRLQLDTLRGPYVLRRDSAVQLALGSTADRPQPRPPRVRIPEPPSRVSLRGGYGRFVSPELDLEFAPRPLSHVFGMLRYTHRSSQGHQPNAAFRRDELELAFLGLPRIPLSRAPWTMELALTGRDHGYRLYGVPKLELPRRLSSVIGQARLRSQAAYGWLVDLQAALRADRALLDTLLDRPDWVADSSLRIPAKVRLSGRHGRVYALLGYRGTGSGLRLELTYEHVQAPQERMQTASGWRMSPRLVGSFEPSSGWAVDAGLQWDLFRGLADSLPGEQLSPYARIAYRLSPQVALWARLQGELKLEAGLGPLLEEMPHVDPRSGQTTPRAPYRVDLGIDAYLFGPFRVHGRAGWAWWRNWAYPEAMAPGRFAVGRAPEVAQLYGEVTLALRPPSGLWAQALGRYERIRQAGSRPVFYAPDWRAQVELGYAFPTGVVLSAEARYVGLRTVGQDRTASPVGPALPVALAYRSLPAYLWVSAELSARLSRFAGLYVRLENLLNQTYYRWEYYPERPIDSRMGLWVRW